MRSKLNEQVTEQIAKVIRAGGSIELAASIVGCSERTVVGWLERGRRSGRREEPYRQLRQAVDQAVAEREAVLVALVAQAAKRGSWRAACWLLERQFPERWAPRPPVTEPDADAEPDPLDQLDEVAVRRSRRLK